MSQIPDNLEQTLWEESITAIESGVSEWKMDIPAVVENVKDNSMRIVTQSPEKSQKRTTKRKQKPQPIPQKSQEQTEQPQQDPQKLQEELEKLSEDPRKIWIVLLRHYPYMEDANFLEYAPLLEKKIHSTITSEENKKLKELGKKLQIIPDYNKAPIWLQNSIGRIFSNPEKTLVICDNETENLPEDKQDKRTVVTARSFQKQFPELKEMIFANLPESKKEEKLIVNQSLLGRLIGETFIQMESSLPLDYPDIDTIVVVSNRSYVDSFNKAWEVMDFSPKEAIKFFEDTGFISYEFYLTSKKDNTTQEFAPTLKIIPESQEEAKHKIRAFQKAEEIQLRSLDESIRTKKSGAIIPFKTILKHSEWKTESIDFDDIITSDDCYILSAMVGSGKSLWTTELVKKIVTEYPEESVLFFEGSDWEKKNFKEIEKDVIEKIIKNRWWDILIVDAFDEIGTDVRKKRKLFAFLKQMCDNGLKVIIIGRQWELPQEKENGLFKTLNLWFDRDAFIRQKGGKYAEKIIELLNRESLWNLAVENPLLVFFICELANCKRDKWLKILSLEKLIEISEKTPDLFKPILYENIVKLILVKHDKKKKFWENTKDNLSRLSDIFGDLSKFAMALTLGKSYTKVFKGTGHRDFFDTINILCKKDEKNNYLFAHRSFEEYFVYKYREDCFKRWKEWIDEWYETLQKEGNYKLTDILSSIWLMNFRLFQEDVEYLLKQEKYIAFDEILESIYITEELLETAEHSLYEQIISMPSFQENSELIENFLVMAGSFGLTDSSRLIILKRVVKLPAFRENPNIIRSFCFLIPLIQNKKEALFLLGEVEKIYPPSFYSYPSELNSNTCYWMARSYCMSGAMDKALFYLNYSLECMPSPSSWELRKVLGEIAQDSLLQTLLQTVDWQAFIQKYEKIVQDMEKSEALSQDKP